MENHQIYSIIAQYKREDPQQGEFCQAFAADSEAMAINDCRVVMADSSGNTPEDAEIVEVVAGINIWRAKPLLDACKELLAAYANVTQRDADTGLDDDGGIDPVIANAVAAISAAESE